MNLLNNVNGILRISLSRRNLQTLLKALDNDVPAKLTRLVGEGVSLTVVAENDAEHYASEARQPEVRGRMGVGPEDVPDKEGGQ